MAVLLGEEEQQVAGGGGEEPQPGDVALAQPGRDRVQGEQRQSGRGR
ncbi:hypothetical protein H3146_26750, partial [Streptomyces sp. OF3]|nr:hypothetical protein [Streptomyces alkaliterrae]